MNQYRKSEPTLALRRWLFACVDDTDGKTPELALTFSGAELQVSKAGATHTTVTGTAAELGDGLYTFTASVADLDTAGLLEFKVEKTGVRLSTRVVGEVVGAPTAQGVTNWFFQCVDDTDGFTAETGLLPFGAAELQLTLNGAAFANYGGTVTEIGDGVYFYVPTQAEKGTAGVIGFKVERTGVRLGLYEVGQVRTAPYGSTTTTEGAIRDRIAAVITALTPASLAGDLFRETRDEYDADFTGWALANAPGSLRRFQVRSLQTDEPPVVSNTDVEERLVTFEIKIAYPQTHRYGSDAGRDRDDVITADFHQIDYAIGMAGRSNFPAGSTYDCCWTAMEREDDRENPAVHFLVMRQTYRFKLAR